MRSNWFILKERAPNALKETYLIFLNILHKVRPNLWVILYIEARYLLSETGIFHFLKSKIFLIL